MMQNWGLTDKSSSKNYKPSSTIRDHLGSLWDNVPYFEGLPFIDYENRENTWGNVFKGILSPYNTKWKEFIIHEIEKRQKEMKQGEGKPETVRDEVNKVLKRMNTLQKQQKIREEQEDRTENSIIKKDLIRSKNRLLNYVSKNISKNEMISKIKLISFNKYSQGQAEKDKAK